MRVAIVGGKLQGVEAAFLAHEAGWEAVLIDKRPRVPAAGLCRSFVQCDVAQDTVALRRAVAGVDLILPALEDTTALRSLKESAAALSVPLAYDAGAYFVTHSKKRSNRLFTGLGIPMPRSWPRCGLPIVAKPSARSGSQGVVKIGTQTELDDFVRRTGSALEYWVLQEYLEGPSYSIEVFGHAGRYLALQVTELDMDRDYDCKRVVAPVEIPESLDRQLREMALDIARGLRLTGVMDVEFIVHEGTAKVLEIDARLPSQTPTVVCLSTGINMLELLGDIYVRDKVPVVPALKASRGVIYEHIKVFPEGLEFRGEHIVGEVDSLELVPDFFGANRGLTNYRTSVFPWVATLITTGDNLKQAWLKRERVIRRISDRVLRDRRG